MSITPVWNEVRKGLMIHGTDWRSVVESIPARVEIDRAAKLMQSKDQLTHSMEGLGYVAGTPVVGTIDSDILKKFMPPIGFYGVEDFTLQWLYRYFIIEGCVETQRKLPMAAWPPMILAMVDDGLHFLVYMSAMICLLEEHGPYGAAWAVTEEQFLDSEYNVQRRLHQTTKLLHPKAQDYGESFRRHGIPGLLPRLWDKIARITQLKANGNTSNFEGLADSAKDLLGYSTIAWSLVLELPEEIRYTYSNPQTITYLRPGEEAEKTT
jgi:hypothetical protein